MELPLNYRYSQVHPDPGWSDGIQLATEEGCSSGLSNSSNNEAVVLNPLGHMIADTAEDEKPKQFRNNKNHTIATWNITGKFTPRMATVKDQNGKVLTEGKEIQERWKQYTQRLYSRDADISNDFTEEEFTEEPEPTLAEIEHAIKELACNKAPGIDNIPIELIGLKSGKE
eukprot:gene13716-biopygen3678